MENQCCIKNPKQRSVRINSKYTSVLFIFIYFILALIFVPQFGKPDNLLNIIKQSSELIILSCGMTFIYINGGIDFSITAVLALSSVVGAKVMQLEFPTGISILLGISSMLAIGVIIGSINGIAVTKLKMPSFIATMATQLVFAGVALTLTESKTVAGIPQAFNMISQGAFFGIQYPIFITLAIFIFSSFLLNRTLFGRQIISVGTNHKASEISGLPIKRLIFRLFLISGVYASLASIIMTGRLGAGVPSLGKDMMMDVVAAVVIGGTDVSGGNGNILGSLIGAVMVVMLNNSLNMVGVPWYYIMLCKGAMILFVSLLSIYRHKKMQGE